MRSIQYSLGAIMLSVAALTATSARAVENGPTPTLPDIQKEGPYTVATQSITGTGFRSGDLPPHSRTN